MGSLPGCFELSRELCGAIHQSLQHGRLSRSSGHLAACHDFPDQSFDYLGRRAEFRETEHGSGAADRVGYAMDFFERRLIPMTCIFNY